MRRHHLTTTSAAFFLLLSHSLLLNPHHPSRHLVEAGCYQPYHPDLSRHRLCCVGRNHTCKSVDERRRSSTSIHRYQDGQRQRVARGTVDDSLVISLLPMRGDQFPPVLEARTRRRLGRLVLPDMVELEERGVDVARRMGE